MVGKLALSLAQGSAGELVPGARVWESQKPSGQKGSLFWWHRYGKAGRLTNSATILSQIQVFELTHPNIFPF